MVNKALANTVGAFLYARLFGIVDDKPKDK